MKITSIIKEDVENIIKDNNLLDLADSTFFITGATGLIGGYFLYTVYLLNKLYNKNHKIILLVRNKDKLPKEIQEDKTIKFLIQDVTEEIKIDEKIDYVIHTAGPASPKVMKVDPLGVNLANTLGTINTLKLAKESNSKGYLFISSREIYGEAASDQKFFYEEGPYGKLDHLIVRNSYSESKKNAENLLACYQYQYDLNVKAVRLAHTYGPGINIHDGRVQSDFLLNYMNNEDIVMNSTGEARRTYTYIGDAINAMFKVLLLAPKEELIYNVSDPENEISIKELAELIASFSDKIKVVQKVQETKNASYAPFSLGILSNEKIKGLGYKGRYDLKDGFARTIKHLEEETC
ncbi:MAG TPA: NAD(P)-dependent oxidoreductase [Candidatus Dojkabacteria bacterium]|nr:NAD(P)-dependent oxidoreductase [Candidatus Dojkabacteria bacterium]